METSGPSEQPRILIVDDEPPLLKMMNVYLQRLGYSVTTSTSTEHAAALVAQEAFAAVVIDGTMPGLSMEELAWCTLQANPSVHVLAASGYPVDMSALEAVAPGRVAFLHKPFTPEMLAAALRRIFAAKKKEEEL
jgi:DNA-binding NtrC family response regulator